MTRKYSLPKFLVNTIDQDKYDRWLHRKAVAHCRRDKARGRKASVEEYKKKIHAAVIICNGKDMYTGERLNWNLLSEYDNQQSKKQGSDYKRKYALLPTIDHEITEEGYVFNICGWKTNDAKNDLDYNEFVDLCKKVIAKHNKHT